jgi:hypothetical protein
MASTLEDLGRERFRDQCERLARIGRVLIEAALHNKCVQEYLAEPTPLPMRGQCQTLKLWTLDGVRRNPPVRHEWEHTTVIAGVGEGMACAKGKTSWGRFIGILPLEPGDPVGYSRVLYVYKASNPYNQRVEQRKAIKRRLGRRFRKLVGRAFQNTKGRFLQECTDDDAQAIKRRLGLDPGRFWRVCKGREKIDIPQPPLQGLLFQDFDEEAA